MSCIFYPNRSNAFSINGSSLPFTTNLTLNFSAGANITLNTASATNASGNVFSMQIAGGAGGGAALAPQSQGPVGNAGRL